MKKTDRVTRKGFFNGVYDSSIDDSGIKFSKVDRIKSFFKKSFNSKFDDLKIRYKKDPKKKIALVLAIVGLFSTLVGSSYAYLTYVSKTNNSTVINAGSLALVFNETSNSIVLSGAIPEADDVGLANSNEYEFSIENTGNIPSTFRLTLDNVCSTTSSYTVNGTSVTPTVCVPNEYIKVAIKEGNNDYRVLEKKSIDGASYILDADGLKPEVIKTYKMKIWLDYNTPNTYSSSGSTVSVFAGKLGLSYEQGSYDKDASGANKPELTDGMIPVYYDSSSNVWKKADVNSTTGEYRWYDYSKKIWANSVTVTSDNRATYESAKLGTTIPMDDILTMQVWIPRYKYKVWNYNADGTVTSDAQKIEVVFESGIESTGDIGCTTSVKGSSGTSEECKLKSNNNVCTDATCNTKMYTHPAFTFGTQQLKGFWIGKFEVSGTVNSIKVKPNEVSLRETSVSSFASGIMNMKSSTLYGLGSSTNTHMIKNNEWGAVAYLSMSDYGINKDIGVNNYANYVTGCGDTSDSLVSGVCNAYNTKKGMYASTSGNIYGVYDMSGGSFEYTMSNIVSTDASTMISGNSSSLNSGYTGVVGSSSFTGVVYPDSSYIDKYTYGTSGSDRVRSKLGDGIKEVYNSTKYGWYNDYSAIANNTNPWFVRGGGYCLEEACAGIFNSDAYYGSAYKNISSRIIIF